MLSAGLIAAIAVFADHTMTVVPPHWLGGAMSGAAAVALGVAAFSVTRRSAAVHQARGVRLGGVLWLTALLIALQDLPDLLSLQSADAIGRVATLLALPALGIGAMWARNVPYGGGSVARTQERQRLALAALLALGILLSLTVTLPANLAPRGSSLMIMSVVVCVLTMAVLAAGAARSAALSHRRTDRLTVLGLVWLAAAQFVLLLSLDESLGWWGGRGLLLVGALLVGVAATYDAASTTPAWPLLGGPRALDVVSDEAAFLDPRVHELLANLATKDGSTEGHTRRVANLAVEIGVELGLPAPRLRELATGGLLHDLGKLDVPDEVLNKPGKLTEAEFAVIQRHPVSGQRRLAKLGGFSPMVLELVNSHHERLDGHGYPLGRTAELLRLETRILTVADVFDALTADRVYRKAWDVGQALNLLERDAGRAFDGACVAALRRVLDRHRAESAAEKATEALTAARARTGAPRSERFHPEAFRAPTPVATVADPKRSRLTRRASRKSSAVS